MSTPAAPGAQPYRKLRAGGVGAQAPSEVGANKTKKGLLAIAVLHLGAAKLWRVESGPGVPTNHLAPP